MDRRDITEEMAKRRLDFRDLVDNATVAELRGPTRDTKWTNEQLLFHMLFGYLLVRNLMTLVRVVARLPRGISRRFAAVLNAATRPFHTVNYLGSLGGARVLGASGMELLMDHVIEHLQTAARKETVDGLNRGMHFPTGWDPYFSDYMTVSDVYHYATQHYDHHRRQLTLTRVG
jgi:hypothetical protein